MLRLLLGPDSEEVTEWSKELHDHELHNLYSSSSIISIISWGFESRQGMTIFLFTAATGPALGPTQLPIQQVSVSLSLV